MSTQERVEVRARDGWNDPGSGRTALPAPARPPADRLPRPPGRRRPGLAVVAVLLIVLGAAVAGLLALRLDNRVPVLVARNDITVGHQITRDDLEQARIASEGVRVIAAGDAATVIGRYASQPIPRGRLLDTDMLAGSSLLTPGRVAIGIALAPGRLPAGGLRSGDVVLVIRGVNGNGKVLASNATVASSPARSSSSTFGGGGGSSNGGSTVVTVVVDQQLAPGIAAAAMADQLSLALVSHGPTGGG